MLWGRAAVGVDYCQKSVRKAWGAVTVVSKCSPQPAGRELLVGVWLWNEAEVQRGTLTVTVSET